MGSIEKRLTLTMRGRSRSEVGVPSAIERSSCFLLVRARPQSWPFLVVDSLALELVDDLVQGGVVAGGPGCTADRLAVDDEGHVHDMALGEVPVPFQRQLDGGLAAVVKQPLQAAHLLLHITPVLIADIEILALDDRAHC